MPIWPFRKIKARLAPQRPNDNPPNSHCSLCGRPRTQVGPMVEGPIQVYICVECVTLAHQIAKANAMSPAVADINNASVWWAGHMHIRCYFRLQQGADGNWIATADDPRVLAGTGKTARESVRDLQTKVLANAIDRFAQGSPVGEDYFTNHVDSRFR